MLFQLENPIMGVRNVLSPILLSFCQEMVAENLWHSGTNIN